MNESIYVASSWRNASRLDEVHAVLKACSLRSYDFRLNGDWWSSISEESRSDIRSFLQVPEGQEVLRSHRQELWACKGLLLVHPSGISSAIEFGVVAGRNKPCIIWGDPRPDDGAGGYDLMWGLATEILAPEANIGEVAQALLRHVRGPKLRGA